MELRVLQYFLAVAREESITGASRILHISQPALSRQLKDLEDEFGKQLMIRGGRKITLTEEGMILRKRAEEIVNLAQKTEAEIMHSDDNISGDIYIGAGETDVMHYLLRPAKRLMDSYPNVHFHISSGDSSDVVEQLDKGLIDFGLLFDPIDQTKYNFMKLPAVDTWGVLMRKDDELAKKEAISPSDLREKPLIVSRHALTNDIPYTWFTEDNHTLNIAATYSLIFNASLMVEDGIGYAITLDKIINTTGESPLCFRPFTPAITASMNIVWKKYQVFTKSAEKYLLELHSELI